MKSEIEIIIPSLGNKKLFKTIESINRGSILPNKIICLINNKKKINMKKKYKNLKIYYTFKKGQILQRLEAFKITSGKFILQLDDDIILEKNCLKNLLKSLKKLGKGNVVGPLFKDLSGEPIHKINRSHFKFFYDIYHYLVCNSKFGFNKSGTLTPIFLSYGVDSSFKYKQKIFNTDWLPGGCVLSYRSDFIEKPTYPFKGKAYCEDIYYSILRRKKKIRHRVITDAIVKTIYTEGNIGSFFQEVKVRKFLIDKFNENKKLRFNIWFLMEFTKKLLFQFFKLNK